MSIPWLIWAGILTGLLLTIRNPFYLLILLGGLLWLGHHFAFARQIRGLWLRQNSRFILTMIFLSTLINAAFTHIGSTIFIQLPSVWPLIGGNITFEGIVYGAINGLVIANLYLLFNVINLVLPIRQLLHLIPRTFYPIAMLMSISLTFFPSIQKRTHDIKEAQMIRGNPMKKASDWLPLIMPLMITSLEDAIQLSESMTARGFSSQTASEHNHNLALMGLILGTFLVFSAWILQMFNYPTLISILLYSFGGGIIILTLVCITKTVQTTRYRQTLWRKSDIIAAVVYSLALIAYLTLSWRGFLPSFSYTPYPTIVLPEIALPGLVFCGLSFLPAILSHD